MEQEQPRTGQPGRPKNPKKVLPEGLPYATVPKEREQGRVKKVTTRVVFDTQAGVRAAWTLSLVSAIVNTVFLARHKGSERPRNRRKVRQTCCFSTEWVVQEAMTYFTMDSYHCGWPVRPWREEVSAGHYRQRTPAMAAGLTDPLWTMRAWATVPAVRKKRDLKCV